NPSRDVSGEVSLFIGTSWTEGLTGDSINQNLTQKTRILQRFCSCCSRRIPLDAWMRLTQTDSLRYYSRIVEQTLTPVEVRVLGSLIEKEITTPEYYPLSLNALTNACNQISNRDPVVSFDEKTVARALESLREKQLVWMVTGVGRVPKYEHRFTEQLK